MPVGPSTVGSLPEREDARDRIEPKIEVQTNCTVGSNCILLMAGIVRLQGMRWRNNSYFLFCYHSAKWFQFLLSLIEISAETVSYVESTVHV